MLQEPSPAVVLRWCTAGLTAVVIYLCWPLWAPLLLAAWTAALARPLLERLALRFRGRRRAAAAMLLLLFVVLAIPVAVLSLAALSSGRDLVQVVAHSGSARSALAFLAGGASGPVPSRPPSMAALVGLLRGYGAEGLGALSDLAGAAGRGLVALLIYFGGAYVFLLDGEAAWGWVRRHAPLPAAALERLRLAFHETGRGLLVGGGLTVAAQGVVATLTYLAIGVPRWWVLGPITGLASIVPLVGSSLVWGPIAIGLFLTGHAGRGAILVGLGVGVIGTVDNVLRPLFARLGALRLPAFVLFVALFGGIATFGAWGALLGPLLVRLWIEAMALGAGGAPPEAVPPKTPAGGTP